MVKSKTKSISNRAGAFSNFSQNWTSAPPQFTERWIDNFLKITAWSWSGSHLVFFYEAWAQKKSAKLQNTCECTDSACTDKTGLSSMKLVWLIQIAGWSANQRTLKMSAELLPLSRLIWERSKRLCYLCTMTIYLHLGPKTGDFFLRKLYRRAIFDASLTSLRVDSFWQTTFQNYHGF